MIVGIMGKSYITESLCKAMIIETMKVIAEPRVTDEHIFLAISHIFTYSKIVEGFGSKPRPNEALILVFNYLPRIKTPYYF